MKCDDFLCAECGIKNPEKPSKQTGRIIGGEPVTPFEFPWIVQLHMPLFDDTATSGGCGGALINDRMILTALVSLKFCTNIYFFLMFY